MMKICASLGSADDIDQDMLCPADIVEIRTDIFPSVPGNVLKKGQTGLISFKDGVIPSMIPAGWMADVGDSERSAACGRADTVITSHHDFTGTPAAGDVVKELEAMDGDIVKGAYAVNTLNDAVELLNASLCVKRKHIIIGMGELGTVTRIRGNILGNEFAFAYVGNKTAPGQLSVSEMSEISEDHMITGILGSDIGYTRSPAMHNAAFAHSGIKGRYLVFDTPSDDLADGFITGFNIKGVNVTKPYKTSIMQFLDSCDRVSEDVGAVNTVLNDKGKLKGYNTDVDGIRAAFAMNNADVKGKRALILGSGGAARACAYFLTENGCRTTVTGRNTEAMKKIARDLPVTATERTSVAVKGYDIIVNCTPLNMKNDVSEYPVNIEQIVHGQIIFDMVYGMTHLTDAAGKRGCVIIRGEDMLAHQGTRSFEIFTSETIPFSVMRDAI